MAGSYTDGVSLDPNGSFPLTVRCPEPPNECHPTIKGTDIITLQVNERSFTIPAYVLCENAAYFDSMLSGIAASSMAPPPRTANGAFIISANPDVF